MLNDLQSRVERAGRLQGAQNGDQVARGRAQRVQAIHEFLQGRAFHNVQIALFFLGVNIRAAAGYSFRESMLACTETGINVLRFRIDSNPS